VLVCNDSRREALRPCDERASFIDEIINKMDLIKASASGLSPAIPVMVSPRLHSFGANL
jgi:hypothetical protein